MSVGQWIYIIFSSIGAFLLALMGGWDIAMQILVVFIAVDFIMGLLVAITKRSPKTGTGGLSSYVCFIGLCRKIAVLLLIMISHALDGLLGTESVSYNHLRAHETPEHIVYRLLLEKKKQT